MAKIGYTRKPDGQNRVPPSTLVPGRHLIGQRPPRPDSGRISNGSNRFWLLTPPSAIRFQSHLPDHGRAIRPAAYARTRHGVIAGRGGSFLRSTWSCVWQNFNIVVHRSPAVARPPSRLLVVHGYTQQSYQALLIVYLTWVQRVLI